VLEKVLIAYCVKTERSTHYAALFFACFAQKPPSVALIQSAASAAVTVQIKNLAKTKCKCGIENDRVPLKC